MVERSRIKNDYKEQIEESQSRLEEYQKALRIDKHDLDTALERQAEVFSRVADEYAITMSQRDLAKAKYEEAEAQADKEIREDADPDDKLTEPQIKRMVILDTDVKEAQRKYLSLAALANRWDQLRTSFTQRSYAVKDLTALHVSGYFTARSTGTARSNERDATADRVRETQRSERAARGRD